MNIELVFPARATAVYAERLAVGDPRQGALTGAFERYRQTVSKQEAADMLTELKAFSREGPLSAWVVIWLMIFQRLRQLGALSAAVRELQCGPVRKFVRCGRG